MSFFRIGVLISAALLPAGVAAQSGGYWDFVEECDYEYVPVDSPVTYCEFHGDVVGHAGYGPVGQITETFSELTSHSGHSSCQEDIWVYEMQRHTYEHDGQTWDDVPFTFSGLIPLVETTHTTEEITERQEVPGSCRMVRVWVPCRFGCSIP